MKRIKETKNNINTQSNRVQRQEKRDFWGLRRRAVGGRTPGASSEGDSGTDAAEESDEQAEKGMEELPDVGGGRGATKLGEGSLQPISYHNLPRVVMDSLNHAHWGQVVLDMTPGFGELCSDMVLQKEGYVGICQTEYQRQYIWSKTVAEILQAMTRADSKVYDVFYAKECGQKRDGEKQDEKTAKSQKTDSGAQKQPNDGWGVKLSAEEAERRRGGRLSAEEAERRRGIRLRVVAGPVVGGGRTEQRIAGNAGSRQGGAHTVSLPQVSRRF